MTPDTSPDVTALVKRWEQAKAAARQQQEIDRGVLSHYAPNARFMTSVVYARANDERLTGYIAAANAVIDAQARRLTEQEAEIARLENRLRWFETAGGVAMATRVHQEIARAAAAEQALTAARLERDEARVGEVVPAGPPRWVCKSCGKPRRRHECLSCGSTAPLTDERHHPGIIR